MTLRRFSRTTILDTRRLQVHLILAAPDKARDTTQIDNECLPFLLKDDKI